MSDVTLENNILTASTPQRVKVWGTVLEAKERFQGDGRLYSVDPNGTLRVHSAGLTKSFDIDFVEQPEFKFTIDTRQTAHGTNGTSTVFRLPFSGNSGNVNWLVDWGDGASDRVTYSPIPSEGELHNYGSPGEYTITIKPINPYEAWLMRFGFGPSITGSENTDARSQENRNKVVSLDSLLDPTMFLTDSQIDDPSTANNVLSYVFRDCKGYGFRLGENFGFSPAWDNVQSIGTDFCQSMFQGCNGHSFTMNDIFTIPQGIVSTGAGFCQSMFQDCNGHSFTMNSCFNLPPHIQLINNAFCHSMFSGCNGESFTMNDIFTIPQGITSIGNNFLQAMFLFCYGFNFRVGAEFKFPRLTTNTANYSFYRTLASLVATNINYPLQERTPTSIINGCVAPNGSRQTFSVGSWLPNSAILITVPLRMYERWGEEEVSELHENWK